MISTDVQALALLVTEGVSPTAATKIIKLIAFSRDATIAKVNKCIADMETFGAKVEALADELADTRRLLATAVQERDAFRTERDTLAARIAEMRRSML